MYAPFLSLLPAKHDCTLGWSDEHMAELAGGSFVFTSNLHLAGSTCIS